MSFIAGKPRLEQRPIQQRRAGVTRWGVIIAGFTVECEAWTQDDGRLAIRLAAPDLARVDVMVEALVEPPAEVERRRALRALIAAAELDDLIADQCADMDERISDRAAEMALAGGA